MAKGNFSCNLIEKLTILFEGPRLVDGRLIYDSVDYFFTSGTMLPHFIRDYVPLKRSNVHIDVLNMDDMISANGQDYVKILVYGKTWDSLDPTERTQAVMNFKLNTNKLKARLLEVIGRELYEELFIDREIRSRKSPKKTVQSCINKNKDNRLDARRKLFYMKKKQNKKKHKLQKYKQSLRRNTKLLQAYQERIDGNTQVNNVAGYQKKQLSNNEKIMFRHILNRTRAFKNKGTK